jgi:hypothetical protein
MPTTKTRRGRPKGTGIDDRASLIRIAALISADPSLKPTTAIRKLGVTEPSVIRRLRDKFKVFRDEYLADAWRQNNPVNLKALQKSGNAYTRPDRSRSAQALQRASRFTPNTMIKSYRSAISLPS